MHCKPVIFETRLVALAVCCSLPARSLPFPCLLLYRFKSSSPLPRMTVKDSTSLIAPTQHDNSIFCCGDRNDHKAMVQFSNVRTRHSECPCSAPKHTLSSTTYLPPHACSPWSRRRAHRPCTRRLPPRAHTHPLYCPELSLLPQHPNPQGLPIPTSLQHPPRNMPVPRQLATGVAASRSASSTSCAGGTYGSGHGKDQRWS